MLSSIPSFWITVLSAVWFRVQVVVATAADPMATVIISQFHGDESITFLQSVQCYYDLETFSRHSNSSHCCTAAQQALQSLQQQQEQQQSTKTTRTTTPLDCQDSVRLEFVWNEPIEVENSTLILLQLWTRTITMSALEIPWNSNESDVWNHYLWKEATQTGSWMEDDNGQARFLPNINSKDVVSSSLQSVLSESGGMHRNLRHTLSVKQKGPFSVLVLLPIPSGLFLNVEDAYEVMRSSSSSSPQEVKTTIRLITDPNTVIDQEEPAFVSPPHAVVYHIQGNMAKNDIPDNVQWNTLLHVRYPYPHMTGTTNITWLSPFIVYDKYNEEQMLEGGGSPPLEKPLLLTVPTGYATDLWPVLIVTFGSALWGTLQLLRTLSKLASANNSNNNKEE